MVDEGNFAQLSCIVMSGDEPLTISWTFHGQGISTDLGIMITPLGTRASMLSIMQVGHQHSGDYTCSAKNRAGVKSETAVLKVNGKQNVFLVCLHFKKIQEGIFFIVLKSLHEGLVHVYVISKKMHPFYNF